MISKRHVRFLQSLKGKKERYRERLFIAEGIKNVLHLISNHTKNHSIYATDGAVQTLRQRKVDTQEISEKTMETISCLSTPSKVLGIFHMPPPREPNWSKKGIYLALQNIQDPGNMGALLRLSEWFGVQGIICSDRGVDLYNPKTVQASMGSLGTVPVYQPKSFHHFVATTPLTTYATDVHQGVDISQIKKYETTTDQGICLILGSEAHGLPKDTIDVCDAKIKIPKPNSKTESLNVGIAAGILLWDIYTKG